MEHGGPGDRQQGPDGEGQRPDAAWQWEEPPPAGAPQWEPPPPPPVAGADARRVLQALAVAVFLSVGAAFSGWVAFGDDGDTGYRAGPLPGVTESPSPTAAPDVPSPDSLPTPAPETGAPTDVPTDLPGVPSPSATPFGTPSSPSSSSPSFTGGDPPAGYSTQSDPAGFHLAVPDGWERTVEGPSVFYTSSDGSTKIQVFELHGPEATPYESAREAERLASRHRDYEQVTLAPLGTAAMDPAELEYTYRSTSDGHRRIMDRRFSAPGGTMYAVLVIGASGDRASEQEVHQAALDTFCPTAYCTAS
ncbi:serine/arginine repetitive matrix protein 2 [Streptomyces sp. NPDC048636]|uniref:SPOR domain-containing protein n=1 Tax=Streptomyces sp. NPDC048636 TaxID=3155762 RepID=UPI0034364227